MQVGEYYVDITRSQFDDSSKRIAIEDKYGDLARIIKVLKDDGYHSYQERKMNIDNHTQRGLQLYNYVRDIANELIAC